MKKKLSFILIVVCMATIIFPLTNTVPNSKIESDIPPIIILPPFNVTEIQTIN